MRATTVSHVSAPRGMRHETNPPMSETRHEKVIETASTKRLISQVLARAKVRQGVRQPVRIVAETVRQPVRQIHGEPAGSPVSTPPATAEDLLCCGYRIPSWTPAGCRRFLAELQAEWSDFHVDGWHGLTMPECWPVALMDAVQTIYVLSIQDHVEGEL